jgi:hypothetical protein
MLDAESVAGYAFSRRSALKRTAGTALLLSSAAMFEPLVKARPALAATKAASSPSFPDIQFDLGAFFPAAQTLNDGGGAVQVGFPPVFALFQPLTLNRTPSTADQTTFANALNQIEESFPASPSGLLIQSVAYGIPYFNLLQQSVVTANIPTDLASGQPALIEAVPFDTDVVGGFVGGPNALVPNVIKARFNVNVVIEANQVLLQTRSDNLANVTNANLWLQGSNNLNGVFVPSPNFKGLFNFQTPRVQFVQQGLPKTIAEANNLEFANRMNSFSTMAMGFIDQQTNSAGPAAITTFAGNSSAVLTSAKAGDYFDNGSFEHFSHDIEDLFQFFATPSQEPNVSPPGEPFTERVQYMFRSNQTGTTNGLPASNAGNSDQFTNGGGPALLDNVFQGTGAALAAAQDSAGQFTATNATLNATFTGTPRIGHEEALQQVSRASDGTPLHIRADGPGFSNMDVPAFNTAGVGTGAGAFVHDGGPNGTNVPAGSNQFKLQFAIYMPTAQIFAKMRNAAAAQQLMVEFLGGSSSDNGLERHITATRRQSFLVPPRRHRSFPLVELQSK